MTDDSERRRTWSAPADSNRGFAWTRLCKDSDVSEGRVRYARPSQHRALATAGEVLTSRTVRNLSADSGLVFKVWEPIS
jgi:hypothetical protein